MILKEHAHFSFRILQSQRPTYTACFKHHKMKRGSLSIADPLSLNKQSVWNGNSVERLESPYCIYSIIIPIVKYHMCFILVSMYWNLDHHISSQLVSQSYASNTLSTYTLVVNLTFRKIQKPVRNVLGYRVWVVIEDKFTIGPAVPVFIPDPNPALWPMSSVVVGNFDHYFTGIYTGNFCQMLR